MSAKGIRAGRAFVELGTEDKKLTAGLRAAQAKLRAFGGLVTKIGGSLVGAGAAILGPLIGATAVFARSGDELNKMAQKTGISVEALSELRHAAKQSAVDFGQLRASIARQNKTVADAARGNKVAAEALARVGLSAQDLISHSPDKQLEMIAAGLTAIVNPTERAAAAMAIYGRSGTELLPLMADVTELRAEARALGLQMSSQDAQAATDFGDAWSRVQSSLGRVVEIVGAALAPTLTDVLNRVTPIVTWVIGWIDQNRQLVVTIASVAGGIVAAGAALVGMGTAAIVAAASIGGLITLTSGLMAVVSAFLSPVGLLIGLTVGLTAALTQWTSTGQAVVGWFGSEFRKLISFVENTVGGMFNALKGGRLDLAAELAFTGVKLAIATVMESVMSLFGASIDDMMKMLAAVVKRIGEMMSQLNVARVSAVNWLTGVLGDLVGVDTTPEQEAAMRQAQGNLTAWQKWDSASSGKGWAEAFDQQAIRAKLDALNADAASAASVADGSDIKIDSLKLDAASIEIPDIDLPSLDDISLGLSEVAEKFSGSGTFSAAAVGGMGADSLAARQLDEAKRSRELLEHIKRNTSTPLAFE